MTTDQGAYIIAQAEARENESARRSDYWQKQYDMYIAENKTSCLDAVYDTDENEIQATLITILDLAKQLMTTEDNISKVSFVKYISNLRVKIIENYANEQADKDLENWEGD